MFPSFAIQETLFQAAKYVSAVKQKHILLLETTLLAWRNWETLWKHVSAANVSRNMFPCFARALLSAPVYIKACLYFCGELRLWSLLDNYLEKCRIFFVFLNLSPTTINMEKGGGGGGGGRSIYPTPNISQIHCPFSSLGPSINFIDNLVCKKP